MLKSPGSHSTRDLLLHTAGPKSLEDYFQKGALLGQKTGLNLWKVYTRPFSKTVPEHLKVCQLNVHKLFLKFRKAKYDRPSNAREQFLRIWPGIDVPKI